MPALKLCGFAPLLFRNTVHYVAAHPAFPCAALSRTYAIKTGGGLGTSIEVAAVDTRSVVTTVQPGETDLTAASRLSPMPYPRTKLRKNGHSFESDSLMPFDPPSPAHCFMKDSAVAVVAQGPYCLLYHSYPHLSSSVISFDMEYAKLNPFWISPEDYPVGWESGQHPDDYQILSVPLKPGFFVAPRRRHDTLLWYRTSFKLGKDKFLPMSFLIWDLELTWASSYIYLHERAHHLLKSHGRFDRHLHHMRFVNGLVCYPDNMTSSLQPPNMQPFNLMGEELIRRLELVRKPNGGGWRWRHGMEYW